MQKTINLIESIPSSKGIDSSSLSIKVAGEYDSFAQKK